MASEKSLLNWIGETPDGFSFSLKAHQAITHIRRLKNAEEIVSRFVSSLEPLLRAGKLAPVLFQLPPNCKADTGVLTEFLCGLPRALRCAFEFRHESWFSDPIFEILRKHNAALCVAESEERVTPDVCTADFCYYRLRKADYSSSEREQIAQRMQGHLSENREVFAFFKHEENPAGALYAAELLEKFATTA
jgi:uncharacterized protein YecE (DUF72 family)